MKIFKRIVAVTAAALSLCSFSVHAETLKTPEIKAKSAILINADTGRILYEKNSHEKLYPASMTKMLTAMVVLDNMEADETIKVDYSINEVPLDSSKAGIAVGEIITVENVVRGLIIPSGNDIANAAASAVAKKALGDDISYEEAEKYFVGLMNTKASELGCKESNFANPHGYHDDNHYTTAYDMSPVAQACMEYDIIAEAARETKFSGNSAGNQKYNVDGKTAEYTWYSHNELITNGANHYEYATGIKTGFTDQAGDCLAASATKDNENLIAIIMNSEDPGRWQDAKILFDWAFENYDMIEYRQSGVAATAKLSGHNRLKGDTAEIKIEENMSAYLTADEAANVQTEIIYDGGGEFLQAPVEQGAKIGKLRFTLNGETIGETDAFSSVEVKKANIFNTSIYYIKTFFSKITAKENLKYTASVLVIIAVIIFILILRHKRKQRYKIKGRYYSERGVYDTRRINNGRRRRKNKRRDKYNKYK